MSAVLCRSRSDTTLKRRRPQGVGIRTEIHSGIGIRENLRRKSAYRIAEANAQQISCFAGIVPLSARASFRYLNAETITVKSRRRYLARADTFARNFSFVSRYRE